MKQLNSALQAAISAPEAADLHQLWQAFDTAIVDLDDQSLLKVAGDAIAQIAAILAAKTGMTLEEVMASVAQDGPVMRLDEFEGYVRQTMQIDLEPYIEPIPMLDVPSQPDRPWAAWTAFQAYQAVESSIVSEVSTSVLEDWIELLQGLTDVSEVAQMEKIKELSHGENIEVWSAQLRACLEKLRSKPDQAIAFLDLVKRMKLPASEVWLAFLLGDHAYQLRRRDEDFYSATGLEVVLNDCLEGVQQNSSPE